jgi:metal-responsive CopG/Arc/MetJ family transcriptional regulator
MKAARATAKRTKPEPDSGASVRATISFPSDRYATLEEIAKQKKVSLAWVVREAVESYLEAKWPLFAQRG